VEVQRVVARDLRHKGAAPVDIEVARVSDGLLRPQTAFVVDEAQTGRAIAGAGQLPPALPGEAPAPVRDWVANRVIGDRLPVIRRQLILITGEGVGQGTVPCPRNIVNCAYDSVKLRLIHEICQGLNINISDFFNSPYFDETNLEP